MIDFITTINIDIKLYVIFNSIRYLAFCLKYRGIVLRQIERREKRRSRSSRVHLITDMSWTSDMTR